MTKDLMELFDTEFLPKWCKEQHKPIQRYQFGGKYWNEAWEAFMSEYLNPQWEENRQEFLDMELLTKRKKRQIEEAAQVEKEIEEFNAEPEQDSTPKSPWELMQEFM